MLLSVSAEGTVRRNGVFAAEEILVRSMAPNQGRFGKHGRGRRSEGAADLSWVGARDAAEHPTVDGSPTAKHYLTPKMSIVPRLRNLRLDVRNFWTWSYINIEMGLQVETIVRRVEHLPEVQNLRVPKTSVFKRNNIKKKSKSIQKLPDEQYTNILSKDSIQQTWDLGRVS